MQSRMPRVEIRRVRGADHSLMANFEVIVEVLERYVMIMISSSFAVVVWFWQGLKALTWRG